MDRKTAARQKVGNEFAVQKQHCENIENINFTRPPNPLFTVGIDNLEKYKQKIKNKKSKILINASGSVALGIF